MCDSSSSSGGRSTSSDSSTRSEEPVTRGDLKNPSRASSPPNKHTASLPAEWLEGESGDAGERRSENDPGHSNLGSGAVRRRPQVSYKTHSQLVKEKLEQIKAEMEKLSEKHLCRRPARKAYHPFVWNSLSPYRDTAEIDYLLARASDHHGRDEGPLMRRKSIRHRTDPACQSLLFLQILK